MDKDTIAQLITELITALGEDVQREGLTNTPMRVAKAYETIFGGYTQNPRDVLTTFDGEHYDEMIICRDIDFYSTCEHHLQPFFGRVHVGYIPNDRIVGISKIPRLVDIFARRLQNQERLTMQIAESIHEHLNPKGVGVVVEAEHLCMKARGVEKQNSKVMTSSFRGNFKIDPKTRAEFLNLIT